MPFYRLFTYDKIIHPDNGPAAAELATIVEEDLLPREPYVSYDIDIEIFFAAGTKRMWADLVGLSDRVWGWETDYSNLRAVALEAIQKHPQQYIETSIFRMVGLLNRHPQMQASVKPQPAPVSGQTDEESDTDQLPTPSEGDLIPQSYLWWLASAPDADRIPTQQESLAFRERVNAFVPLLPNRDGSPFIAEILNQLSAGHPTMLTYIVVGTIGVVLFRPKDWLLLLFLVYLTLAVPIVGWLGAGATIQHSIPFYPMFMLLGVVGFGLPCLPVVTDTIGKPPSNRVL